MATMQLELWDPVEQDAATERPPVAGLQTPGRLAAAKAPPADSAPAAPPASGRESVLDSLRAKLSRIESGRRDPLAAAISCGSPELDQLLPGGGLTPGTLNEWVGESHGCGAGWLSLLAAREALAGGGSQAGGEPRTGGKRGRLVVIDGSETSRGSGAFYPPAAIAAGIPADQIIVVRVAGRSDFVWAADQALRSPAVAVVWGFLETLDDRDARRLQLAAETGRTTAMFVRPQAALREPSWAEVRWHVRGIPTPSPDQPLEQAAQEPASRRWRAEERGSGDRRLRARLVRCRGGRAGGSVILRIDAAGRLHHDTASNARHSAALPLVAQLAHPAAAQRAVRRRA
ncbi:ImuA family protein [Candidatus Laterigemmans baculatus]|uniref:ImuA family protein n=1 Tax=Candidatus Laterigemmans baculatus TaxID=2770505 RepID=UPI0013DB3230|nr:hypothetical protein [Candidatus Laterigemmans baculatus]